ncbi:MAG TPA: hypothetical protein PLL36_00340 [Candidatus Hydrogenedentes bacterium]|nr:hypothetical protein [Candidatus Hydrogenedentota bacterium]HOH29844.1 hypothetical protein [Candidatus Hydrogenedentota bacterium]HQM99488.1 hypothetical protein [Candidatus Hydrogenedentota bacterium]
MSKNTVTMTLLALILLCGSARAENSLGGYSSMEIEAGSMRGNFATGAIEEMTGGVRIRLVSTDPGLAPLPIKAGSMKFTWGEGKATPSTITMETNVLVTHPDAEISAGRAEWNFDSGELVFSGNPVVNSERLKGLRGERMVLNLKTNTFEVTQVRADQVPLQGAQAAAPGPAAHADELRTSDIADWTRFIDAIKGEAQGEAPSPGKQILNQLTAENQRLLLQMDTDLLLERKEDILRLINSVLSQPDFYSPQAWERLSLPEEATSLVGKKSLDSGEQVRFNRLLLEAAYPFAFVQS